MDVKYEAAGGAIMIKEPKTIAIIKVCDALTFHINETMSFTPPTPEQRKNLKELFAIDVTIVEE